MSDDCALPIYFLVCLRIWLPRRPHRDRLDALLRRGMALALAVERWSQVGIKVISRSDAAYPQRLRSQLKGAAPPILYGAGFGSS